MKNSKKRFSDNWKTCIRAADTAVKEMEAAVIPGKKSTREEIRDTLTENVRKTAEKNRKKAASIPRHR